MAVYEQSYKRYLGGLTAPRWRFLVLSRYAYEGFKTRIFTVLFILSLLVPFAGLLMIYLHHNITALNFLNLPLEELKANLPIDEAFFSTGLNVQGFFCFLLVLVAGPSLIAPDLRNNGLALLLARPISRAEYVLGKMAVLAVLLSLITWVPGLILFAFQGYLDGAGWLGEHARIAAALFVGSWVWIVLLSLVTLAISAQVKWRPVARIALIMLFFVLTGFGAGINEGLDTWWGMTLSIWAVIQNVWASLFGLAVEDREMQIPLWSAWASIAAFCAVSLAVLARRIRAYEEVR